MKLKNNFYYSQILLLLLGVVLFGILIQQSDANETKFRVMIPPFENVSNVKSMTSYGITPSFEITFSPSFISNEKNTQKQSNEIQVDRYAEAPRALVEDKIVNLGVTVVERQRLDQLMLESKFSRSGLIEMENALEVGKSLGATHLVMGTIISINTRQSNSQYRNTSISSTRLTCTMKIRMIAIETGNIVFSKATKGTVKYLNSEFGSTVDDDAIYSAIEKAVDNIFDDDLKEYLIKNKKG